MKLNLKKYKDRENSYGAKIDRGRTATTRHLTRIITYLSEVEKDYFENMRRKLNIDFYQLRDALNFLGNYKILLKFKNNQEKKFYSLNPLFLK